MNFPELARKIGTSPTSLFLGAGSSLMAGGPNGSQLVESIQLEYKKTQNDFFKLLEDVIGIDDAGRAPVEIFIRKALALIHPTDFHRYLFSLPWKAVLTTNYDQLPDMMGKTIDGSRTFKTIVRPYDDVNVERLDTLYCFKLFGDVVIKYPDDGCMVLTETDRRQAYSNQSEMYKRFHDISTTGSIVYIGYSFKDSLVFDILADMRRILRGVSWPGYAIMPHQPSPDILEKMRQSKIEVIVGTADEFINECKKVHSTIPKSAQIEVHHTLIHRLLLSLGRDVESNISGKYRFLNQSDLDTHANAIDFIKGNDRSFKPLKENWDFPRRFNCRKIRHDLPHISSSKEFVDARINLDSSANRIFAITGAAASGKSVAAKRVAFDWYNSGNPVIFAEHPLNLDRNVLVDLLDQMRDKYLATQNTDPSNAKSLRFLLVIENCKPYLSEIVDISKHLLAIGKPVDILIVERNNTIPFENARALGLDMVLELNDGITREEQQQFFDHFSRLGMLVDKHALFANIENPDINSSFFALLYTSINNIQETLSQSIRIAYNELDSDAKQIYSIVSVFRVYNQKAYLDVIEKATGIGAFEIEKRLENDLTPLISYDKKFQIASVNQRIIAEIVADEEFKTNAALKAILLKIIRSLTVGNKNHMDLLDDLVIRRVSQESRFRSFTFQDKEELFLAAISVIRSGVLLHHLARLYLFEKRVDQCRDFLRRAYDTREMRRKEKEYYLKDTEARMEMEEARMAAIAGNKDEIYPHYIRASGLFKEAQINEIITPHPYQGLSQCYYEMSRYSPSLHDKLNLLTLAISLSSSYKTIVGSEAHAAVEDLIRKIYSEFDGLGFDRNMAIEIAKGFNNAEGFAYLAEKQLGAALVDDYLIKPELKSKLSEALRLINEGLTYDKSSIWLNQLKVGYIKKLFPDDVASLGTALEEWQRNSKKPNMILNFELAKYKYMNGQERDALRVFKEVSRQTYDHPERLYHNFESDTWELSGLPRVFRGKLIKVPRRDDWGHVVCAPGEPLREPLLAAFRAIKYDNPRKGDEVYFNIAFNFAGPQGINMRLL